MTGTVPPLAVWARAVVRGIVARRWPGGSAWIDGVGQVEAEEYRRAVREYYRARRRGVDHEPALLVAAHVLTPGWNAFREPEARHRAVMDARIVVEDVLARVPEVES